MTDRGECEGEAGMMMMRMMVMIMVMVVMTMTMMNDDNCDADDEDAGDEMPSRRRHVCSYIIFVSGYADVSQTSLKAFHVCVLHAGRGALAIAIASSVVVVIAVTAAAAAPAANMILAGSRTCS